MAGSAAQTALLMSMVPLAPAPEPQLGGVGTQPQPSPDPAQAGWPSMLHDSTNPIFDTITTLNAEQFLSLIRVYATNPGPPPAWSGLSMNCLGIAPGPPGPGGANIIVGNKNSINRWLLMFPNTENENGGNSGSNLTLHRYSDTGVDLDLTDGFLKIFRSTGQVWFREGGILLGDTTQAPAQPTYLTFNVLPTNAASDAAAAAAGVGVGGVYRSGSVLMVRVA